MKRSQIIILVLAIFVFGFLFSRDYLANFVWQKYQKPEAALRLVRQDAALAMQLGNYYFRGGKYDLGKAERAY